MLTRNGRRRQSAVDRGKAETAEIELCGYRPVFLRQPGGRDPRLCDQARDGVRFSNRHVSDFGRAQPSRRRGRALRDQHGKLVRRLRGKARRRHADVGAGRRERIEIFRIVEKRDVGRARAIKRRDAGLGGDAKYLRTVVDIRSCCEVVSDPQKLDRGLDHPLECVLLKHNKAMPYSIGI
jgi:hypothetical protein